MYTREIERLVRMFVGQKLDRVYIKHYIMENFQLDDRTAETVLDRCGVKPPPSGRRGAVEDKGAGIRKQGFF
jgi:hypothetical protein